MNDRTQQALEPTALVDIKDRLAQDSSGEVALAMIADFHNAARPVQAALKGVLAPADFKAAEGMNQALHAAQHVVRTVWENLHPGKRLSLGE
jgi:hypothetical protein